MKAKDLFPSPELYPWQVDGDCILLREMQREHYKRSIFTDHRIEAASETIHSIEIARMGTESF